MSLSYWFSSFLKCICIIVNWILPPPTAKGNSQRHTSATESEVLSGRSFTGWQFPLLCKGLLCV